MTHETEADGNGVAVSQLMDLSGRLATVTGAAQGIGMAIAHLLWRLEPRSSSHIWMGETPKARRWNCLQSGAVVSGLAELHAWL